MVIDTVMARLTLDTHRAARLDRARGVTLRARCGTAWVTIDGDARDIVLEPGQRFIVDSAQPVLLLPLSGTAVVDVLEPMRARPRRGQSHWLARLLDALRRGPQRGYATRMA